MSFDSLHEFLSSLEALGDLKRIKAPVDPVHELGAIAYHSLLEKVRRCSSKNKDRSTPLVTNVLSTDRKVAVALGIEGDLCTMFEKFLSGFRNPVEPKVLSRWAELALE